MYDTISFSFRHLCKGLGSGPKYPEQKAAKKDPVSVDTTRVVLRIGVTYHLESMLMHTSLA